jgi:hypothetical protein
VSKSPSDPPDKPDTSGGPSSPAPGKEVPVFYTNSISITAGIYDISMMLGFRVGAEQSPAALIVMSPQHALATYLLLGRYLRAYEEKLGAKIQLPEELKEQLQSGQLELVQPGKTDKES